MATVTAHPNCRRARNASLLLGAAALTTILLGLGTTQQSSDEELEGRAPTTEELRPSVEAAFPRESYAPGASALLVFFSDARGVRLRIFHTGPEHAHTVGYSQMQGVPVTKNETIGIVRKGSAVRIRVGNWASGLYFARLTASDGRVGFAPFVVRPRRFGEHRVAVVLPTLTWQAYNLRDDNGDGQGDTWYAN